MTKYSEADKQMARDNAYQSASLKFARFGTNDDDSPRWGLIVPKSEGAKVAAAHGVCAVTTSRGDTAFVLLVEPIEHDGANVFPMVRTAGGKSSTVQVTAWVTERLFSDRGERDVTYSHVKADQPAKPAAEDTPSPIAALFGQPVAGTKSTGRAVKSSGAAKGAAKGASKPTPLPVADDQVAALLAE